jgi:NAD(P)-dependent dehydrogenase (short-subunit alcohol dehydrogenase family)
MNVTRAVLPVLRGQRAGHVITISSLAGLIGQEFCAAYAASKFGLEGWMESLRFDVAPFDIHTTIVEPGFFRTELLVDSSTTWPALSIEDYAPRTAQMIETWKSHNGAQPGDPAKLARALLTIAEQDEPPLRFIAGVDAIDAAQGKADELLKQAQDSRELGANLAYDDVTAERRDRPA